MVYNLSEHRTPNNINTPILSKVCIYNHLQHVFSLRPRFYETFTLHFLRHEILPGFGGPIRLGLNDEAN